MSDTYQRLVAAIVASIDARCRAAENDRGGEIVRQQTDERHLWSAAALILSPEEMTRLKSGQDIRNVAQSAVRDWLTATRDC
jgi:hypothetical protein